VPDGDRSQATRAAWLSYIGGLTQAEIAERMGVSRVKVNRLISEAVAAGMVRVFVDGTDANCVALEKRIADQWGLEFCTVAPTVDDETLPLRTLAAAGGFFLHRVLERQEAKVIGVGHGRTLAEVVKALPQIACPDVRFVSLLGSLTRHAAANPFDVIHRLTEITGAESHFMPAPFFLDSIADKQVLLAQKSLKDVFALAASATLYVVGIGDVGPCSHLLQTGMLKPEEHKELQRIGAVGELLGRFVDAHGRPVAAEINERAMAFPLENLNRRRVVAIAGGTAKAEAIAAVLESQVITGLITDEVTAQKVVTLAAETLPAGTRTVRRKQPVREC
jgi:DNA-binding transcriptional regulator LsrR (DeoR family)